MPSIPVFAGTGGSFTVLAADDGRAAVEQLLDEAVAVSGYDGAEAVVVSELDGVQIVEGRFSIPAGGWGFTVISVRAADDPFATLYVSSGAD